MLNRFKRAVGGVGSIYGPFPPAPHQTLERYNYQLSAQGGAEFVFEQLKPYLGPAKTAQFKHAFRERTKPKYNRS